MFSKKGNINLHLMIELEIPKNKVKKIREYFKKKHYILIDAFELI